MNLIRWVISFLFFSNSPFLIAQSGFKKVVNFEGYLNLNFANIEFHDDKLYVVGDGYNMDKNLRGVFIAVFDTLGSLIRHTTYYDRKGGVTYVRYSAQFIFDKQNKIYVPIQYYGRNPGLLIYDESSDSFSTKEYENDKPFFHSNDLILWGNNLFLFGYIQDDNLNLENYMMKTDLEGNLLWIKYFGDPPFDEEYGGVFDNKNGTFTVSSSIRYSSGGQLQWTIPWIYQVDTNGILVHLWKGDPNDACTFAGRQIHVLDNQQIIILGREFGEGVLEEEAFAHSASSLDSNYNCQWKIYLRHFNSGFDDIVDFEYDSVRNDFLAAGYRTVYNNFTNTGLKVWVNRFNSKGEILWEVTDTIINNRPDDAWHYMYGMTLSPSGSIYLAGEILHFIDGLPSYGWLAKMTPDGCMDTLCVVTSTTSTKIPQHQTLFPNPSNGKIQLPLNAEVINIHSINGYLIRFEQIDNYLELIDWIPGLHIIQYEQAGKIFVEKVLMIR